MYVVLTERHQVVIQGESEQEYRLVDVAVT